MNWFRVCLVAFFLVAWAGTLFLQRQVRLHRARREHNRLAGMRKLSVIADPKPAARRAPINVREFP